MILPCRLAAPLLNKKRNQIRAKQRKREWIMYRKDVQHDERPSEGGGVGIGVEALMAAHAMRAVSIVVLSERHLLGGGLGHGP